MAAAANKYVGSHVTVLNLNPIVQIVDGRTLVCGHAAHACLISSFITSHSPVLLRVPVSAQCKQTDDTKSQAHANGTLMARSGSDQRMRRV